MTREVGAKASPDATRELRLEAMVMARLGSHPNIVSIIGVITRGDPLVLVVSFCEHGSLLSLLRKRVKSGQPLSNASKVKMACDIANGMAHLETHRFVHRDLAYASALPPPLDWLFARRSHCGGPPRVTPGARCT